MQDGSSFSSQNPVAIEHFGYLQGPATQTCWLYYFQDCPKDSPFNPNIYRKNQLSFHGFTWGCFKQSLANGWNSDFQLQNYKSSTLNTDRERERKNANPLKLIVNNSITCDCNCKFTLAVCSWWFWTVFPRWYRWCLLMSSPQIAGFQLLYLLFVAT